MSEAQDGARICVAVALEKKATDLILLDVTVPVVIADYFLIATGQNKRQIQAIVDETKRRMRAAGLAHEGHTHVEGYDEGHWVLMDFGDVVVHLFDPPTRAYYELERVWADAPRVEWQEWFPVEIQRAPEDAAE